LTMRGMFLLCLIVVGIGLVYVITIGALHR
jgi:hypothetical protein